MEIVFLNRQLPKDGIRLESRDQEICLQIICNEEIDLTLQVEEYDFWWNYYKLGSNTKHESDWDGGGSDGNSSLGAVGSLNQQSLYVRLTGGEEDIVLQEVDILWDGDPRWRYNKFRPLKEKPIRCFDLSKLVNILEGTNAIHNKRNLQN